MGRAALLYSLNMAVGLNGSGSLDCCNDISVVSLKTFVLSIVL